MVASNNEIQTPTLTAGREQKEEFRGSPDSENTNEEEENSTKQTNNKSPEDELDIELFVDLVRQFPVIWNTGLNGFKDYNNKKFAWNNISTSLLTIYMQVGLCFSIVEAMLLNCLNVFCSLS